MKILFLDNDGVICLSNNWGERAKKWANFKRDNPDTDATFDNKPIQCRFDDFDSKAVKVLNEILEETGAEIVVSSDWRLHANLEELGDYYESQGIIKRPIAVTDQFKDMYPSEWSGGFRFRADLELERSYEIKDWLEGHPEVTHWVAVDDLNMSVEFLGDRFSSKDETDKNPGLTNFVLTPRSREGIKQSGVKEKIIKFLTNEEHKPDIQD
jgi:hypothetical protein